MKPRHKTKNSQRCGKEFECKSGPILLCQCQTVELGLEQLEYISERYDDCLCASCLLALRGGFNELLHKKKIKQFSVR